MTELEAQLAAAQDDAETAKGGKAWAEIGLEGGELHTGALAHEITDSWDDVLRGFGLDPSVFEVVGDTVRMSKWQQSKRTEDGDRDIVWLYSYKAQFRRKSATSLSDDELEQLRADIAKWKPHKPTSSKATSATPCTFVVCWADWQLAKSAGGGVRATVERVQRSLAATQERITELRKIGRNIDQIAIVNMGDALEGVDGQYASQLFSVELTQREQLILALDLFAQGVRLLAPMASSSYFISLLSNHGEWTRRGGNRSVTTDSDNMDGFLGDALQRVMEGRPEVEHTKWLVPHDEMVTCVDLNGVNVAFTHGHKIGRNELDYLRGQSIRILRDEGREPDLWVTAHRHHVKIDDFGPWWRFQCPSLDGGSKWYADTKGFYSTAGTLTFCVGEHSELGWSDLAVL